MIYCDIEDNIQHIVDVGSIASDGLTLNSEDTRTTKKKIPNMNRKYSKLFSIRYSGGIWAMLL